MNVTMFARYQIDDLINHDHGEDTQKERKCSIEIPHTKSLIFIFIVINEVIGKRGLGFLENLHEGHVGHDS
eukprot:CAMPEP_0194072922 /NCGR_PEP_ID=MMETSP0149-20130528/526_1 /TAXON_ID=122233 /ORGANISM="Chaetoceros debilis, Strain MM31A-1" /LENGTH=70 /DNA_ID=CAMNT_0038752863 /DNA_START=70 /DNA_END=279 /DNA_ORIENTATION=+